MRVGIDVRKLGDGGIGVYIRETVAALVRLAPDLDIVAFGPPGRRHELPAPGAKWVAVRARKYSVAEHLTLPVEVRRAGVDVYHSPHYVLPLGLDVPAVVTVHDLIHILFPRTPLHPLYARRMITSACRRARRVIAVSETTARDLERHLGVDGAKIRVIHNGVSPRFRPIGEAAARIHLERLGVRRPYVLFVGNWLPHKNVEGLIRAWGGLATPRPDLVLCGVGLEGAGPVRRALAEVPESEQVRFVGPLADDALVALYGCAELFALPSLYEGFALPVVEAFACGTPVLGTAAGAVPEVAGDAALLVPPQRVDMFRDGMYRLLQDRGLRAELIERGLRRISRFSWEEAARKTLSVYEEVSGGAEPANS